MILTEQKINRIGRLYWRGSILNSWEESKHNFECYYVTTKPNYAVAYAKDDNEIYHYLTQYSLKEKINIFNMRYTKDVEKLKDFLRIHDLLFMFDNYFKYLKEEDWLNVLSYRERSIFIEMIRQLGYDGFFNIERTGGYIKREDMGFEPKKDESDLYGFSGIGLFDKSCLIFKQQYCSWEQIKNIEGIKEERKHQFDYIKQYLINIFSIDKKIDIEDLYFRFFLLSKTEINKILETFDYKKEKKLQKELELRSKTNRLKRLKERNNHKTIIKENYTENQLLKDLKNMNKNLSKKLNKNKKLMQNITKLEDL